MEQKKCNTCSEIKAIELFIKQKNICKDCNNQKRKTQYKENEDLRKKIIQQVTIFKHNKVQKRQEELRQTQLEIGENNQQCKYCETIFPKVNFRHNRQKCNDCEKRDGREYRQSDLGKEKTKDWLENNRERLKECVRLWTYNRLQTDPVFKFINVQRRRIRYALKQRKTDRTIDYLGCSANQFFHWMNYQFNENFTFENHGTVWHIDHVIPISRFNLENNDEQYLSLNWRNTMPLSVYENLSKHNKIIQSQIEKHYQTLLSYHKEFQIKFPQEFIDMYVQHDQIAGNPLES
jgi:hypothetical protein